MLVTREDLENELVAQLQVASNSSLFPSTRITELIQNAYIEATEMYPWNDLVRGRRTNSQANHEYYDYPSDFRTGTIVRLELDDVPYERKNFEDYLAYKNEHPNSTFKMFAVFGRQYFIWPVPTSTSSSYNLSIWGSIQAPNLEDSTDETIFSNNKEDCNMAVVDLAFSVGTKRIDSTVSREARNSAIAVLGKRFSDEQARTQRDQRIQHPKYIVPDYFATGSSITPIGGFNYDPSSEL